jgi:hypothetical protein
VNDNKNEDGRAGDFPSSRMRGKEEERFLSAQVNRVAGATREEKVGLLRSE